MQHKLIARGLQISAVLMAACIAALAAAACAPQRTTIEVDGSSTVFRITQKAAEAWRETATGSGVQVPINVSGTGGGFERFITGDTAISNASRPIKPEERQAAQANGVEFVELIVAYDGIAVVTNTDISFVSCLSVQQLSQIWGAESTVQNWSQIQDADFPDRDINLFGPDSDSGTFDYFTEEINGQEDLSRADYSASPNDNVLVQGVENTPGSLGYFGLSYYLENQDSLRLIAVDDGSGCVAPDLATVGNGTYTPLSRPLFIYVNSQELQRAEVRNFVEYYLDNAATLAADARYVPLPQSEIDAEIAKLDAAVN